MEFIKNIIFTAVVVSFSILAIKKRNSDSNKIAIDIIALVLSAVFCSVYMNLFWSVSSQTILDLGVVYARNYSILRNYFNYIVNLSNFAFSAFFATSIIKIVYKKTRIVIEQRLLQK